MIGISESATPFFLHFFPPILHANCSTGSKFDFCYRSSASSPSHVQGSASDPTAIFFSEAVNWFRLLAFSLIRLFLFVELVGEFDWLDSSAGRFH